MSEEKFYAKPWKCALPGCDDSQIHRHTPTAWVTELATANKKIEDQGIIQNAIIADIADLRGQLDTIRASSASQDKVVEGLREALEEAQRDIELNNKSAAIATIRHALARLTAAPEKKP